MIVEVRTLHFRCPNKKHAECKIQMARYGNGIGAYCRHPKCKAAVFLTDKEVDEWQYEDKTVELVK